MLAILLPPSEGKAPGGGAPRWSPRSGVFGPRLGAPRRAVAEALADAGGGDAALLGVTGPTLERARAANVALLGAPTLPAAARFTGVVWEHLAVDALPTAARRRAGDGVVIVSALAGLSALDDPLPDFRLKLSATLAPMGRLAAWWRPQLSPVLDRHLDGALVVDLLPQEHRAAWEPDPSRYDLRRVRLVGPDGRTAGHGAKAAKGALARALLTARNPARVLSAGEMDGFRIDVTRP